MASAIAQLACSSSIISNRRIQLQTRSYSRPASFRPGKVLSVMSSDEHGADISNSENKTTPSYVDASKSHNGSSVKSHPLTEGPVVGASNGHVQEQLISQPKRAAKIHDFCFGIPFGGLVLGGGLVGFIFTRNPVTLSTGVLFGGALLALSTISLKVSELLFSSAGFCIPQLTGKCRHCLQTKKLFPTGFSAVISAAMLCFYSYVVISGGNPPPKKLKPSATVESS
ncbi:hypothetical protein DH2020_016637 [Rehmannia glutinosa]|uniref:Protein FATTY ACID EXPORT 1, chloroplastic n=1 Tax=Rehmannia glutinosa TaxID=99300 RepID=A0ABR0WS08_REHGL